HRLVPLGEAELEVECVRLDDVLHAKVDVVKIDVQGYDHEVIEGLERTLAANPDAIVVTELSLTQLARRAIEPEAIVGRYLELGFTISTLDPSGALRRTSAAAIVEDGRAGRVPSEIPLVLQPRHGSSRRPARIDGLEIAEWADGIVVTDPAAG